MDAFEREAQNSGYTAIAGVDEAGRGPLAGPVVAAAVIFRDPPADSAIDDSKKLSPGKREVLAAEIFSTAESVGVGLVWPEEIDRLNIHRGALLAMAKAVEDLSLRPDFLLIDGIFEIPSATPQRAVKSGDSLSVSIAAASIIAKTTRDRLMAGYHERWPLYGFDAHKGYPTKAHREALRVHGPCPIHRRTFRGVER
ncbi:MAG: ribonuclease HII [Thermodesulfobacteriota bacterium]